jgi:hypothetical protein
MEVLKTKLQQGKTYYLIGENNLPLIDLIIFENSITIQEHNIIPDTSHAYRLFLDKEKTTNELLVFTTRTSAIMSYFIYQIDITVDLIGGGIPDSSPVFTICSGLPIFGIFNETYSLLVRPE